MKLTSIYHSFAKTTIVSIAIVGSLLASGARAETVNLTDLFKELDVPASTLQTFNSSAGSVTSNPKYKLLMDKCRAYDNAVADCENNIVFGTVEKPDAPESQRAMNKMTIILPSGRRQIVPVNISGGTLTYDRSQIPETAIGVINVSFYKGSSKTPFQRCDADIVACGNKVIGCPSNREAASCSPTVAFSSHVNMNCVCPSGQMLESCENNIPACVPGGPACGPDEVGVGSECKKTWSCASLPPGSPSLSASCSGTAVAINAPGNYFPPSMVCPGTGGPCPSNTGNNGGTGGPGGNGNDGGNGNNNQEPEPAESGLVCKSDEVADGKVCKKKWSCSSLTNEEISHLQGVCTTNSQVLTRSSTSYFPTSLQCVGMKVCSSTGGGDGSSSCSDTRPDSVVKALFCSNEDAKDKCDKVRGAGSKNCNTCPATVTTVTQMVNINLPEGKDGEYYYHQLMGNYGNLAPIQYLKSCDYLPPCGGSGQVGSNLQMEPMSTFTMECRAGKWVQTGQVMTRGVCPCHKYESRHRCGYDNLYQLESDGGICTGYGGGFYGPKGTTWQQGKRLTGSPDGSRLIDPRGLDDR
jgi:hypothetical protein